MDLALIAGKEVCLCKNYFRVVKTDEVLQKYLIVLSEVVEHKFIFCIKECRVTLPENTALQSHLLHNSSHTYC